MHWNQRKDELTFLGGSIGTPMEKRRREQLRRQKQLDKKQRRVQRVADKEKRVLEGGKDADLEGMVPGPQPQSSTRIPRCKTGVKNAACVAAVRLSIMRRVSSE